MALRDADGFHQRWNGRSPIDLEWLADVLPVAYAVALTHDLTTTRESAREDRGA